MCMGAGDLGVSSTSSSLAHRGARFRARPAPGAPTPPSRRRWQSCAPPAARAPAPPRWPGSEQTCRWGVGDGGGMRVRRAMYEHGAGAAQQGGRVCPLPSPCKHAAHGAHLTRWLCMGRCTMIQGRNSDHTWGAGGWRGRRQGLEEAGETVSGAPHHSLAPAAAQALAPAVQTPLHRSAALCGTHRGGGVGPDAADHTLLHLQAHVLAPAPLQVHLLALRDTGGVAGGRERVGLARVSLGGSRPEACAPAPGPLALFPASRSRDRHPRWRCRPQPAPACAPQSPSQTGAPPAAA